MKNSKAVPLYENGGQHNYKAMEKNLQPTYSEV